MSTTCPNGHESEWADWCSVCGENLGGTSPGSAAPSGSSTQSPDPDPPASTPAPDGPTCSNCGEIAHPDDAFCEVCGYDFASGTLPVLVEATPAAAAPAASPDAQPAGPRTPLTVTVTIDTEFFSATTADVELALPDPLPAAAEIVLEASRNLVGRHSESRGILPEIDVEALTSDPGVSSRHLMFERTDSDIWTFTDLGSTNGTYLSSEATADPITAGAALPVNDGLQIWLGAWTRLDLSLPAD